MNRISEEKVVPVVFVAEAFKEFVLKDLYMNRMVINLKSKGCSMEEALEYTFNSCILDDTFAEEQYTTFLLKWRSKQ